jgi:hypothetical protein
VIERWALTRMPQRAGRQAILRAMPTAARLRRLRPQPAHRRVPIWIPAPRRTVDPVQAGVDPSAIAPPEAIARLAAAPVFIAGSARSGTTWTLDLFAAHPEVAAVTEPWILNQTHGVTSVMTQDTWIPGVRDAVFESVGLPHAAAALMPYEVMVRDLADLVATWLMRAAEPQHRFLVVKEPIDVRAVATMFPGARFIHVVRDGRNVALSMRRASESWDPSMGAGLPMSVRAEAWRRQLENVRAHRAWLGDRFLEVRYEDIRADVAAATRKLYDFAGIPYDDALLADVRAKTDLANQPEAARSSGFRGGGARSGWRKEFSLRDAAGFDRAAGDLLVELGYERNRRWWLRPRQLRSISSMR